MPPVSVTSPYTMAHHDRIPLVFQFPKEDPKELLDELDLVVREVAASVPAPVPALVAMLAPPPITEALMGWEPHIFAQLEAAGIHEVPANLHAPMHLPGHVLVHALTHAPVPVPVHTNVSAAPLPLPVPMTMY